jgi:hypothetical protein
MTMIVAVVSTVKKPSERVVDFVRGLVARGDEVHLFTPAGESWLEQDIAPVPRLHVPDRQESHHPVLRIERMLVHRIPRVVSRVGERMAAARPEQSIGRLGAAAARAQRRVSRGVHRRLFLPGYRQFRPLVMSWVFRPHLRTLELDRVHRIVATDLNAVPFAVRMARRYPSATATNSLRLD